MISERDQSLPLADYRNPLLLGLTIRIALYLLAGEIGLYFDERLYDARAESFLGNGEYRGYLFTPGYAGILALSKWLLGSNGIEGLRILQILCSCSIGYFIIRTSALLFGAKSARIAGYLWACYLPLAMYSHRIWPETMFLALFVPALYLLMQSKKGSESRRIQIGRAAGAGFLFGLSLYMKESATYLSVLIVFWLVFSEPRLKHSGLSFFFATVVTLVPLTTWNYAQLGEFVPVGGTLPVNLHYGISPPYLNFDYNFIRRKTREAGAREFLQVHVNRTFADFGEGWRMSTKETVRERSAEELANAIDYVSERKWQFVLTRVKKLADFHTPLSFMIRDVAFAYRGPLARSGLRHAVIIISLLSTCILLILAWVSFVQLRGTTHFSFVAIVCSYFGLLALLMSMSRFRIPLVPIFLVLVSAFSWKKVLEDNRSGKIAMVGGIAFLLICWMINFHEVWEVIKLAWLSSDYEFRSR